MAFGMFSYIIMIMCRKENKCVNVNSRKPGYLEVAGPLFYMDW